MKLLLKFNYILIESRARTLFKSDCKIAINDSGMASQNLINCKFCPAIKLRVHEFRNLAIHKVEFLEPQNKKQNSPQAGTAGRHAE